MFFLAYLYNAEKYLENIDLEELELIYLEVTYTPKDFSDSFKEFADVNLEGFDTDNKLFDAATGLDFFNFLSQKLMITLKLLINNLSFWYFGRIYTKLDNV